jgi:hypothetical protein
MNFDVVTARLAEAIECIDTEGSKTTIGTQNVFQIDDGVHYRRPGIDLASRIRIRDQTTRSKPEFWSWLGSSSLRERKPG